MAVKILPFAETDLQESMDWYSLQRQALEYEFLNEIKKTIHLISQNPLAYQIKYQRKGIGIRQAIVNRFPFVIAYFIDQTSGYILVFAIWHTARNANKLKKRIR